MKRFAILAAAALVAAVVTGVASSGNYGPSVCGGKQVVNVTYTLTNDADGGFYGDWATDTLSRSLKVFAVGDGTYCATVNDTGSFVTTGPLSPQNGASLSAGIKGTVNGGYYTNQIVGTFGGSPYKTNGNLGTFDANGPHPSWASYFSPLTSSNQFVDWGWTYHTAKNGDWTNAASGSSGDISG
jgi:hypothetical protein